jgi:GrpB-like predicted nucleotidyltransferase (UPF0157 family)
MTQIERIVGPYEERQAICQVYDHRTAEVAQQVAASIQAHLPCVLAEHIGSTSVPGCAGKGTVDLMLVYPDGQLAAARDLLGALGFQKQTTRDPFPEDRPMRTGSVVYDGTTLLLHVHVIAASSPEVEQLRRFRDQLRADPGLVAAYVAAKKAILASGVTDSLDYCIRKGEFIQQALGPRRMMAPFISTTFRQLTVIVVDGTYAVCRLEPDAPIPAWATADDLVSITRTGDELSIVCRQDAVPEGIPRERGWRCLRVAGTLPFSAVGVLASLTAPLAEAGISVFVVSTFDTDYLLVKAEDLPKTVGVLWQQGHTV